MTVLNVEKATNLVLEANTQEKIDYAINVISFPSTNCLVNELTAYQQDMYLEQLNLNSCNLEINGTI